jgi:hypothetical protein
MQVGYMSPYGEFAFNDCVNHAPKHLQCFDNCGICRTDDAKEAENLEKLLELNLQVLEENGGRIRL